MDYITVKEFAERTGISKQAVYKKIKNPDFQKYVEKIGNSIMISELALVENSKLDVEDSVENSKPTVENSKPDINKEVESNQPEVENIKLTTDDLVENNKSEVENSKPTVENSCTTCLLVENLQKENEYIKKQLEDIIHLSNKQINQIDSLYSQIKDKDKLIEQLSTQILNQTRLPVIVEPPKQTFWQKLKLKIFKK